MSAPAVTIMAPAGAGCRFDPAAFDGQVGETVSLRLGDVELLSARLLDVKVIDRGKAVILQLESADVALSSTLTADLRDGT